MREEECYCDRFVTELDALNESLVLRLLGDSLVLSSSMTFCDGLRIVDKDDTAMVSVALTCYASRDTFLASWFAFVAFDMSLNCQ